MVKCNNINDIINFVKTNYIERETLPIFTRNLSFFNLDKIKVGFVS